MPAQAASPKPVYALVGEDSFLQLQSLADACAKLPKDAARVEFDGERAELSDVLDELRSFAMFGGGKVVIIRAADDFISKYREQLEDYLAEPSSSSTLVLRVTTLMKSTRIYKLIDKIGQIIVCEPPKDRELPGWIMNRAKTVHDFAIAIDAANLLAELIGADLGRLDNELAKLALQVEPGKKAEMKDVSGSVVFQREQEIKDMTIELATGQPGAAVKRWRHLVQLDKSAEFRAVTWLTMWLEDVGVVVNNGNTSKMTWKYRDQLPQFLNAAKTLGKARYGRAVDLLAEIDKQSKSGVGDMADNVERFILSFAE